MLEMLLCCCLADTRALASKPLAMKVRFSHASRHWRQDLLVGSCVVMQVKPAQIYICYIQSILISSAECFSPASDIKSDQLTLAHTHRAKSLCGC